MKTLKKMKSNHPKDKNMRYFQETIKYMWKNLLRLIPYAILPAAAMALSGSLGSAFTFFFRYGDNVSSYTVWDIYKFFSVLFSGNWLIGLSAVIVVGFFMCLLFGAIDRHMKVGKFSYKNMFSRLNETVLAVFPTYFAMFALLELIALLNSSLIYIFTKSMGFNSIFIAIPISAAMYACFFLTLTQFVLLIPSEIVVGYPFKDAVINSIRLVSGSGHTIFLQLSGVLMGCALLSGIFDLISFGIMPIRFIVDFVLYMAILIFVTSYMMVSYFILSNEPRRDVEEKKKYLT